MKRLLFITRYMPPHPGIGAVRTGQIARLLPLFGWDVSVVTAALDGHSFDSQHVIETPLFDVRQYAKSKLRIGGRTTHEALGITEPAYNARRNVRQFAIEAMYTISSYATDRIGWFAAARGHVRRLVKSGRFDAVLSTGPPQSAHMLAAHIAREIPWTADFRDLWFGNPAWEKQPFVLVDFFAERTVLKRASALVTVSQPLVEVLKARYGKPVYRIPNAFESAEWAAVPFGRENRYRVLYAGSLHFGRRDPHPLFAAAARLLHSGEITPEQLEIALYVAPQPWLDKLVDEYGLRDVVSIFPFQERKAIMALERRADLLWVALFESARDVGEVPGKVFEYLGAGRPILATGGPPAHCELDTLLAETGAGKRLLSVDDIADLLKQSIRQRDGADVKPNTDRGRLYEAHALAERFARVLDSTV